MQDAKHHILPLYSDRPIRELESEITQLAGHINAASHRFLTLIAEFDDRNGWVDSATQSCAHWLNWKIGIDLGAAREKVRVAHALGKLPKISASMAKGELSYSKVRAITRVATEATEDTLLMIALHGSAHHVESVVRSYRSAVKAFQRKTNELVQKHVGALMTREVPPDYLAIDESTIEAIKAKEEGTATKVINLVKSIEKTAEENQDDPFLVALADRARLVQESFEDRQSTTADALADLLKAVEDNERRRKDQAAKRVDSITYFALCKLTDDGIPNAEVHELLHFSVPNHGKLWKSLMRAHVGNYEALDARLRKKASFV